MSIYKGKGKDPLSCHSYTLLQFSWRSLSTPYSIECCQYLKAWSPFPYSNCLPEAHVISCQNTIFATQEAIQHNLRDGRVSYLSLEKASDSVKHCFLLQSLFDAGINGKAWRLIKACYSNLTAVVKSESTPSDCFSVTHGVQQGSVLSPPYFLSLWTNYYNSWGTHLQGYQFAASISAVQLMPTTFVLLHPQLLSPKSKVRSCMILP